MSPCPETIAVFVRRGEDFGLGCICVVTLKRFPDGRGTLIPHPDPVLPDLQVKKGGLGFSSSTRFSTARDNCEVIRPESVLLPVFNAAETSRQKASCSVAFPGSTSF